MEEDAGPYPGRISDSAMVLDSRIEKRLAGFCGQEGRDYKLFVDPAFGALRFISKPFRHTVATEVESIRNTRISRVRVTVEQTIGHITQQLSAVVFVRTERVGDGDVCKRNLVGCFLRNVWTCVRGGNQILEFFGWCPPTLEYFLEERQFRDPLPPRLEQMGVFQLRTSEEQEDE